MAQEMGEYGGRDRACLKPDSVAPTNKVLPLYQPTKLASLARPPCGDHQGSDFSEEYKLDHDQL